MSEENSINWNDALRPVDTQIDLRSVGIDEQHTIEVESIRQNDDGSIVATVSSDTLEGNTLWLRSAKYGAQNGLASLLKASENNPIGSFVYTKVASENSPVGYAHLWSKV